MILLRKYQWLKVHQTLNVALNNFELNNIQQVSKMKGSLLLITAALCSAQSAYVRPIVVRPDPNSRIAPQNNAQLFQSLGEMFHRLHVATVKRCANVFDESCINGDIGSAGADSEWLSGGNNPGKRCANVFDEGCVNGGMGGAGADDDWLNNGNTPGKRCANVFDESCSNGGLNGAGEDESWLGVYSPGRR